MIVRPHGGVGALMDAQARRVHEGGGSIRCCAAVQRLEPSQNGVELETPSGWEEVAHAIITLPLPVVASRTGRVANFQNWSPRNGEGPTILAAEVWCDDSDEAWTGDEADVAAHTVHELESAGLLCASSVIDAHVERVRRAFPILRVGDTSVLQSVARHLDSLPNVDLTARPNANVKVGVHQSVILGIEAAERVAARLRRD
jgi:protoporphyrinogen oxidase